MAHAHGVSRDSRFNIHMKSTAAGTASDVDANTRLVDPRSFWGPALLELPLSACGVYASASATEAIAPAARRFFERQDRAERAKKQSPVARSPIDAGGSPSPVAERISRRSAAGSASGGDASR